MDDSTSISSIDFLSNSYHGKNFLKRMNCYDRHAELFRKDLISAMKMPDSETLQPDDYFEIIDSWKLEWERGVQVPVNVNAFVPVVKIVPCPQDFSDREMFIMPKKMLYSGSILDDSFKPFLHELYDLQKQVTLTCRYDLDELDSAWLKIFNQSQGEMGEPSLSESDMERIMEEMEVQCHSKMNEAVRTIEGLGIEYDENVVCDICRSPEGEESNEMVFCDNCDICVHQACYGIQNIPEGSWLCRTCALGIKPKCVLCPMVGGAMKSTKNGDKWAHISCALWVPEVSIGCPERMEPITNISQIPASRWALVCTLCRERSGACIQCSVRSCKTSFHVTCAFKYGLDLSTVIDDETEDVQMKAYCPKHSGVEDVPLKGEAEGAELDGGEVVEPVDKVKEGSDRKSKRNKDGLTEEQRTEIRSQKMKRLTEDFYTFVDTEEASQSLAIPLNVVDAIHSYWTLKRKSRFDVALTTIKTEEDGNSTPCQGEEKLVERLKMFIQLRQDLERVRNLCYMVNKREKMKRHERRMKEEIFHRQVTLYSRYLAKQEADDNMDDMCGIANGVKNFSRPLPPPRKFQLSDSDDDDDDDNEFSRNFHKPAVSNQLSKYLQTIDSDDDNDEFRSLDDDYEFKGIIGGGGGGDDDGSATVKKDPTKMSDEEKNFLLTAHRSTGTIYDMPGYALSCSFKDCHLLKSDKNFIRSAVAAAVASRRIDDDDDDDDDDEIFPKSFKYDMKIDEDSLDNYCIGTRGRGRPRKNKRGRPPRVPAESNKVAQIAALEEDDSDYYRRLSDEDFDEENVKISTKEATPPPPPLPPAVVLPEKKKRGRKRKSELTSNVATPTTDKNKHAKKKSTDVSSEPRKKRKYTKRKGVKIVEINSDKDKLEKEEDEDDDDGLKKDDRPKIISSPESYLDTSCLSPTPVVNEPGETSLCSDVEQNATKPSIHKHSGDDDDDDDDVIIKESNARFILSDDEEEDEVDPEVKARREKAAELLKDMEVSDSSTEEEEEVGFKAEDLKSPADDITEADDIIVYDIESQDDLEEPAIKIDDVRTPMQVDDIQDNVTMATTTINSTLLGSSSPLFSSSDDDDDDDDDVSIGNNEKNNSKVTGVINKELLNINSRHKLLHKLPIKEFIVSNQIKNMVQNFFSNIGSTNGGSNPRLAFNGFKLPQGRIEC